METENLPFGLSERDVLLNELMIQQSESIKLMKMSKGYQWEIKLLSLDIDRLEQLNKEMVKRFTNAEAKISE